MTTAQTAAWPAGREEGTGDWISDIEYARQWWRTYMAQPRASFTTPSVRSPGRHYRYFVSPAVLGGYERFFVRVQANGDTLYVGQYMPDSYELRPTQKSVFDRGSDVAHTFAALARAMRPESGPLPKITPIGQCSECGRALSDPASVIIGVGPECRKGLGYDVPRLTRFLAAQHPTEAR